MNRRQQNIKRLYGGGAADLKGGMALHLIKLCVGVDSVVHLRALLAARGEKPHRHITRMSPKRVDELLDGGSLYWVIKGQVLARQTIRGLEKVAGADGVERCALLLDTAVIRTEAAPRRPFQGWRYLAPEDSPRDLPQGRAADDALPEDLARALAELGLR